VTRDEWIAAFAARLGIAPPDGPTTAALLALAAAAAHQSERTAAPIACYLAGRANVDPLQAAQLAEGPAEPETGE
jgi:hypothetical protein